MSAFIQIRVNETERQVFERGAKKLGVTLTGFVKEAVIFYLRQAPVAKTDPFAEALDQLSHAGSIEVPVEVKRLFATVRADVASGKSKGLNRKEALALLRKNSSKKQ
jgi:hypothetical protein